MRNIGIDQFFIMGKEYQILKSSEEELTYLDLHIMLFNYASLLENTEMVVTKEALSQFKFEERWAEIMEKADNESTKNDIVQEIELSTIQEIIENVELTFLSELSHKMVYEVLEKRFSSEKLLQYPEKLFAKNVFDRLPVVAKFDFTESCKCLAFDRYTASAFHALRGTEDVLKLFYENLLNVKSVNETWHFFIQQIESKSKKAIINPPVSNEMTSVLDLIRDYYRNKTQHPYLIYSSDECQDLLTHCIRSVNQMIKELHERGLL